MSGCRRLSALACSLVVALLVIGAAHGDIGIRKLTPTSARRGDAITVVAAGYLGRRPWRAMPVVMIPTQLAPKLRPVRGGFGRPLALRTELRPPRYRVVGSVQNCRPRDQTGASTRGVLRFRLPAVSPGRYVFALFATPGRPDGDVPETL